MQKEKSKQELKQMTLLEVKSEEIEREPTKKYTTKYFDINTNDTALDKLNEKVNSKNKKGFLKYTEAQQKEMRMEFIQKKMSPLLPNINGEEWEMSRRSLFNEIFGEEF